MIRAVETCKTRIQQARWFSQILKNRYVTHKPWIFSHLINTACNCKCPFCMWRFPLENELTTAEILKLHREAAEYGFIMNYLWGGEPLMHPDLAKICRQSMQLGMTTVVNTNGWFLCERDEFLESCRTIVVSLDAPDARHDEIRRRPGLFEKVIAGIEHVKRRFPKTLISLNCVLSQLNRDVVPELGRLAADLDVGIFFTVATPEAGQQWSGGIDDVVLNRDAMSQIYGQVAALKKRGVKVNCSDHYIDTLIGQNYSLRCHWPFIVFTVMSNGDVSDCTTRSAVGNVRDGSLRDVIESPAYRAHQEKARICRFSDHPECICADMVETSALYEGRLNVIRHFIGAHARSSLR